MFDATYYDDPDRTLIAKGIWVQLSADLQGSICGEREIANEK